MKNFLFFIPVLVFLLTAQGYASATTIKTDQSRERLVGPVRTVLVEITQIKQKNGKAQEEPRIPWLSRIYNRRGFIIEEDQLYRNISLNFKSRFVFDELSNLKEGVETDAKGQVTFTWLYTHDPQKNKMEERRVDSGGRLFSSTTYYYDVRGNLIEERNFRSHTKNYFKWVFLYDNDGKKKKESYYFVRPGDRPAQMKEILNFRSDFFYDREGVLSEEIRYDGSGTVEWDKHFKYEFDEVGNWVSQKAFQSPGLSTELALEPTGITYRTITYFQ